MLIEKTINSPFVHLSIENCIFEITGNSFSEDLDSIYANIIEWIDTNIPKIDCEITCKFNLHVYNSVTYKNLLLIMSKFHEYIKNGKTIKIIWFYYPEDEDSIAIGEDLKDIFDLPIELKETLD